MQAQDEQDGTNKAPIEEQAEELMPADEDTFIAEDRAKIGLDSPGDASKYLH